jgi:magnesium transporter
MVLGRAVESPMLRRFQITDNRLVQREGDDGDVLVYFGPDETERKHLVDAFKVDEHTLTSALDPDELARLEFEPDHVAMILKRPKNYSSADEFLFKVNSTGMFLFKDRLIIVLAEETPLFEGRQFARVGSLQELLLKLIYRSIFHYEEHLKVINMISSQLEQEISTAMENKHLLNLFTLEKSLVYYVNAINSNARLIEKLKNYSARVGFTPDNVEFLDDLIIENNQCQEQANVYSQVLSGLMDARVSIVSNNLNLLMKTLTLVMIAIMTPQLVVSIFSMNVKFPLQEHPLAFWIIMAMTVCSMGVVFLVWRYKKW